MHAATVARTGLAGAVGGAGGAASLTAVRALDRQEPTARNKLYVGTTMVGAFGGSVGAGWLAAASTGQTARALPSGTRLGSAALAGVAAGVFGYGALVGATRCNTTDIGINELEQDAFTRGHHQRLLPAMGIGTAVMGGIGALAGRGRGAVIGALAGPLVGAAGAAVVTTMGQGTPYRPGRDGVDDVADALWRGVQGAADHGGSVEAGPATGKPSKGRSEFDAKGARFYDAADQAGNGDGRVDFDELAAHVRSFDADGDGHVSWGSEWQALHAATVE